MTKDWYIRRQGKIGGPLAASELKELGKAGKIKLSDEVSNSKDGPWSPIEKLKGLELRPVQNLSIAKIEQAPMPSPVEHIQGERVLWKGCPSQWSNFGVYVRCLLFCWLIAPIFWAIYKSLLISSTRYELTNERLNITSGIIATISDSLELYRIKDSRFQQTAIQRMFGLGDVLLATTEPSSPVVSLKSIYEAKELRETIRAVVDRQRDRKGVRAIEHC